MNRKYILGVLILLLLLNFPAAADSKSNSAFPYHTFVSKSLSYGYKNFISPINTSSCSMDPTCSQYAKDSFKKYNPLTAWLKTSDRLIRCSNDSENYHRSFINGMVRFYDPVNNDSINFQFNNNQSTSFTLTQNYKNEIRVPEKNNGVNKANANLLYEFAQNLEYEGNIEKAIIEYRRLLSYYPKSEFRPKAQEAVFRLLYKQKNYLEAIKWGKRIIQEETTKVDTIKLKYFMGCAYYRIDNFDQAIKYFRGIRNSDREDLIDRTYLLEGLSYVSQEKWDEAIKIFENINSNSSYYNKAQEFIELSNEGENLKFKDPKVAGALSIVPGLGYYYTGYKETARSSFFVNSLFLWATVQSFENNNDGLGSLLAVFSAGFYSGNIYGSMQTAEKKNKLIKEKHLMKFNVNFKF